MSNDIAIPFKGQQVPAAFRAAAPEAESLAEGIGSSYGVIGYKGKVFVLRYRGERYVFTRPDDGTQAGYIDVIILRQARNKSKSFYAEGFDEHQSVGKRPTCASLNGVTPDVDAMQPQATACAICPRNVWKMKDGRKHRECADFKRLAVLLLPTTTQRMLGAPLMEPVFLRIPPASLNDLATFGETMAAQGWPFFSFVTRITFDPEKAHPQLQFRPLQALTDKEAPIVLPLRDDILAKRITGEEIDSAPLLEQQAAPAPLELAPATTAPAKATTPVTASPAPSVAPAPIEMGIAPPAPAVAPAPSPSEPAHVETGFGVALNGGGQPAAVAPVQQTVEDTGEPSEADANLNARVAALFANK